MKYFIYILTHEKGGGKPFLLTCTILFVPTEAFLALPGSSPPFADMEAESTWFGQTQQQRRKQKNPGFLTFNQKPKAVPGACWLPGTDLAPMEIMNTRGRSEVI